jgi:hypothetical protein
MAAYHVLWTRERSYENVIQVLPYEISNYRMKQISHTISIPSTPLFQSTSPHRQKCKLTIDCTTRIRSLTQLIASFPWTPARCAAYSRLRSIHRVVRVGLWNYILLVAGDGSILVFTACSPCCYTGTVHYR